MNGISFSFICCYDIVFVKFHNVDVGSSVGSRSPHACRGLIHDLLGSWGRDHRYQTSKTRVRNFRMATKGITYYISRLRGRGDNGTHPGSATYALVSTHTHSLTHSLSLSLFLSLSLSHSLSHTHTCTHMRSYTLACVQTQARSLIHSLSLSLSLSPSLISLTLSSHSTLLSFSHTHTRTHTHTHRNTCKTHTTDVHVGELH